MNDAKMFSWYLNNDCNKKEVFQENGEVCLLYSVPDAPWRSSGLGAGMKFLIKDFEHTPTNAPTLSNSNDSGNDDSESHGSSIHPSCKTRTFSKYLSLSLIVALVVTVYIIQ